MSYHSRLRGLLNLKARSADRPAGRRQAPRCDPILPRVEHLEDRLVPAVQLTYGGPGTPLQLVENSSGSTPTVSLSDSFTPILTINLGANTFDGMSTHSAAGLTYQNTGSPGTSHTAAIDISRLNNISTLQALLTGDALSVGIIADMRGGLGAIAASAATINVTSLNTSYATPGNVSLQAAGGLTVNSNGLIDTGNGTISLAADVNADGTGNANTNPLTIASGAVVASSNASSSAITLRGRR